MTTSQPPEKSIYPAVEANPDFVQIEEQMLAFWRENNVFAASVENRPARNADGSSNNYIFYDGPPFANGLPHYGHLLTGYVKDMVARYWTMKGKRVERRFGWDCHGLPAEMESEKQLGISGRQKIIEYGIDKFNEHCRTSVMRYTQEWENYVTRQARWVDFKNDYKTMDVNFMESVLWAFKQLYDKGLVYESYRVMPYSWGAETVLSNFETRLDNATREKEDKAITVAFELIDKPEGAPDANKYYVLAWTTTPWTLPSNLALAMHPHQMYFGHVKDGVCYIASPSAINSLFDKKYEVGADGDDKYESADKQPPYWNLGASFLNLHYKPLFPYFAETQPDKAFRILDGSEFIEEGSGTGVVHMAPGFGEDDQKTCEANGISLIVPVDEKGRFTDEIYDLPYGPHPTLSQRERASLPLPLGEVGEQREPGEGKILKLKGLNVIQETKGKDDSEPYTEKNLLDFGLANLRIIDYLKHTGALIKQEQYIHNYPHCWRTDTPIIYRAVPSWYVEVTKFKDRAGELNKKINWIPNHVRDGAMGHMLATAPDWSISRNRFWGCPIPVWKSPSGKIKVFGSIAELEKASGQKVPDLHRPYIDNIIIKDGGEEYRRVEEVLDCWFESGSMPYAQLHYPFENKERFEENFPADFITEYVGQTRGWFNTLIMLSTAIFDKEPFENCICHGVVIDEETGLKYSKRLKNYKDPMEVFNQFGADALRWLMISSGVMRGADLGVDPEGKFIRDVVRLYIKPIWNAYNFFTLYANADGVRSEFSLASENLMDRYILAKAKEMVETIEKSMDAYDAPGACDAVSRFVEVLNNWYIRRSRPRFWKSEKDADKQAAYNTLFTVLNILCRAAAPLLPLTLEAVFRGLNTGAAKSVHLENFPTEIYNLATGVDTLMHDMDRVRDICNATLSIRNTENIRVRQPLGSLTVYRANLKTERDYFADLIAEETNVKEIRFHEELEEVAALKLKINFPVAGKRLGAKMKEVGAAAKSGKWEKKADGIYVGGELMQPEEYELLLESKIAKGAMALSTNDALVVLDLNITPELAAEGIARDVIRLVQESRKAANLDISDHIALTIDAPAEVGKALEQHIGFICEQVLATSLTLGKTEKSEHAFDHTLEGEKIVIAFTPEKSIKKGAA